MSSISSFSGSYSPNSNALSQPLTRMDKLKAYLCPKCGRSYDFYFRNGVFIGRVPLILQCNHTMCEECIRNTFNEGKIRCVDCQEPSKLDDKSLKLKIQDVFPVNFYLLGLIHYFKPNQNDVSKLSLKPAGMSYKNKSRMSGVPGIGLLNCGEFSQDLLRAAYSGICAFQEKCCQPSCNKSAGLRCFECNEVYCENCCQMVHKAARGLQTHKITSLGSDFLPELSEKCKVHSLPLEFHCNTCNSVLCCYCIVHNHSGHNYYQLSFLNDVDRPKFDDLLQNAEEKLKKLLVAYQKVSNELNTNCTPNMPSGTETEIGKYFANIHAHLQCIEQQLQKDLSEAKNSNANILNNINSELTTNIRNLSGLLTIAKSVMYKTNSERKLNVKVITERLENALKLPCYVIGQQQNMDCLGFIHGDLLNNLEKNFCINVESSDPFRLVNEDLLPDGFDTVLPDAIALMSIEDINQMIQSPSVSDSTNSSIPSLMAPHKLVSPGDLLSNALQSRSDDSSTTSSNTIENWVQSAATEMKKSTTVPSLKIEDRENILVTHIDTPECFYVQLIRLNKCLYSLSRDIDQHIRNFAPVVKSPELNKLYIVKYEVRNARPAWYRARVIDIMMGPNGQDQQYCVQFIDYGNTSIVNRNMLREISSMLAKAKPFALQCKLMNIYPVAPEWDAKTMKLMAQIINGSDVIMVVMNNSEGILEVDLISMPHGASVRDALIFVGDALPCHPNSGTSLTELALRTSKPLPKLHKRTERFPKGQSVDVYISHVVDPYNVYVQMADFVHHIDHLSDVMTHYYNNKSNKGFSNAKNENIYVPRKDMIVAVRNGEGSNSLWYRGTVNKKYDGQGTVDVFLVDIGKSITVSYTNIRKLAERFRNLECQAILVKMIHIEPLNMQPVWNDSANGFLCKYILQKNKLRMLAYDPLGIPPEVLLFEHYPTVDICINAVMVKEGLAKAIRGVSLEVEWMQQQPIIKKDVPFVFDLLDTIQSTKKTNKDYESGDETDDQNIVRKPINVLVTESPDLIYVSSKDEESRRALHNLQMELQQYYSVHHSNIHKWQENDPCVVYNKGKGLYYRAVILKALNKNEFRVLLRDFAEEITVNARDIYVLENQFKQALEGTIRCHMGGISPAGDSSKWTLMAIDFLQNVFEKESTFFMSKNGPADTERKSLSVELWYSEFKAGAALEPSKTIYHSINKLLVKKGLALRQRVLSAPAKKVQHVVGEIEEPVRETEKTNRYRKDIAPNARNEPSTKVYKTKKTNFKNTKDKEGFKPIDAPSITPLIDNQVFYSTDAEFLHPGPEIFKSKYKQLERPKSEELNDFAAAIDKAGASSLSTGNSPTHYKHPIPSIISVPEDMPSVNDWNELIKIHEVSKSSNVAPTSEPVTDWLPPVPFTEQSFDAIATFVDDNAYIYLHNEKYACGLKEMEEKMKSVFDALPSEPRGTIWVPGQICTVKYYLTSNWYRGRIVEINDEHIKVFMVDYGNIEECKHEDLRFKVMYTKLPAFANKIQLYKVFPKSNEKWLTSDLDELHRMVVEKKISVMLKGNIKENFVTPATVKVEDTIINEWMLRKSTNLAPFRVKQSVMPDTEDVVIEEEQSDDQELPNQCLSPNFLPPNVTYTWKVLNKTLENQHVSVGVVNILSFDKFIIEFVDDANTEARALFEHMSDDLKSKAAEQPLLLDLQLGQACIAQFSEDGEWYRGQVYNLENINYGVVEIWFVDFGNFENVQRDCIRVIHPNWLQLSVQQYVSQIYGIDLSDESYFEEVLQEMSPYCNTIKTAEIVSVEPLLIQLFEEDNELCYKDLIERKMLNYRK